MRHKIRGRFWQVRKVPFLGKKLGDCDAPQTKNKQIRILSSLEGQERLRVLLHESLHAGLWDLDEEVIEELSSDIARLIWKEIKL